MYLVVLMKVAKIKKTEVKKKIAEEELEFSFKKLICTIGIILLILTVFYFITTLVIKPIVKDKQPSHVQFDSSKITMSQLLTRKDSEYYVLATKESAYLNLGTNMNYTELYRNYIKTYEGKEDSIKFYKIDMDEAFNSEYWSDEMDIDNLKINDDVLFKIVDGEIDEYFVGHEEILKELQEL